MDNTLKTQLTERFCEALIYAAKAHRYQLRKGTSIPYVGHLLGVASIVIDAGGTEDEVIAALLHDAPEDQGGRPRLDDIRETFGPRVAEIVEALSDALESDPDTKPEWSERKRRYRDHLADLRDPSVLLVSAADKLHNLRATWSDWQSIGDEVWTRFNAGREASLENYRALYEIYASPMVDDDRRKRIVKEIQSLLRSLESAHA